jgi:hypothetical protein
MSVKMRGVFRVVIWLVVGAVIGVAFGFLVGWVIWPIEFTEADPTVLEEGYQRDYTVMIAAAYELNGDLALAQRRLGTLGMGDSDGWLLSVTVDHILGQGDEGEIRHLVRLADDLGLASPLMAPYLSKPGSSPASGVEPGGDQ